MKFMHSKENNITLIYDEDCGVCEWCNQRVRNNLVKDVELLSLGKSNNILQSFTKEYNFKLSLLEESIVVIYKNKMYTHGDGVMLLLSHTVGYMRFIYFLFLIIPLSIREWLYKYFVKNRYSLSNLFGLTVCKV